MATSVVNPRAQFFANNGRPLIGGRIHTYVAGSSTRARTYKDAAKAQPNTNPIILDGRGEAQIYLAEGVEYKFVVEDSKGALIYTQEPVYGAIWPNAADWPSDATLAFKYAMQSEAARDEAYAAVESIGVVHFFDKYADYAGGISAGEIVEIANDETRNNFRTRYKIQIDGSLQYLVTLPSQSSIRHAILSYPDYAAASAAAATLPDGQKIEAPDVDGRLSRFDVQSGELTHKSLAADAESTSFIQAGVGAVERTVQDKMREWVSVKDFGAVGDGVADDSAAILAAITAAGGKQVKIPPGTYRITSLIEYSGPVSLQGEEGAVFIMEGDGRFLFSSAPVSIPHLSHDLQAGRNSVSFLSSHGLLPGDVFVLYNPQDYSWASYRAYYRDGCMFKVDTVTDTTTVKTYGVAPDTYTFANFEAYKLVGQGVSIKDITLRPSASTATVLLWIDGHVGVDVSGVVIEKGATYTGIEIWRCFDVRVSGCSGELSGGDSYPIAISNSQKVTVSDCELYSARHCIGLGGRTGDACVPTRDVLITHCNLYNASSGGFGAADIHGNCENIHYSNCYFNTCANVAGANVKYSNCVIIGRDPATYPDGNCAYGSEVVKGVFEFEDCRFITYGNGESFGAFVHINVDNRKASVTVRVKGCTGENRGASSTIRCVTIGVGNTTLGVGNVDLAVQDFTFVSSVPSFAIAMWSGLANVSSVASTVIDNLIAPSGSALVGASASVNYAMPMRLPTQSGRQAITATSGTAFTTGVSQTFRYIYPRVPYAQVTTGNDTSKNYNGNRAIFGLCQRVTKSAITPWIESGDATNWTDTYATHVMWQVGIDEV